jgi:flagellar assembly protein FliH
MSGRVLKAGEARAQTRVAYNFDDIRQQGEQWLTEARTEAERVIAEADAQAAGIREQARAAGFAQGRDDGLRDAERLIREQSEARSGQLVAERLQTALPAVTALADELRRERDLWLAHWERIGIELAMTISEKLLRAELERRPELVAGRVTELLRLAAGSPEITVRLNPVDLELLGDVAGLLGRGLANATAVRVVGDASLGAGDCVVETTHGELDARITTQMQRLVAELQGDLA